MDTLIRMARECALKLKKSDRVLIVSHIDADGLCSAGIACKSLERAGIETDVMFVKQLDENALNEISSRDQGTVLFTDLGSGMQDEIISRDIDAVIADHHLPQGSSCKYHLNPHLAGLDGGEELSGSSTTYLLARELGLNFDLVTLAIVGSVGDLQDSRNRKLTGLNREIMLEGVKGGFIEKIIDLRMFGKQTRPVFRMLQYSSDPSIPGITGNEDGCIRFLKDLNIPLKDGDRWRKWIDLEFEERKEIVSGLVKIAIDSGLSPYIINRLVGEVYILLNEEEGTELRDAMEFSTLLNATARYGHEEIGLKICLGDRNTALKKAIKLLSEHRKNLAEGLTLVRENGIEKLDNIQYFHAGDKIRETIVGIVAGMSLPIADSSKPIIAFAEKDDGIKVSARGTRELIRRGLNLAKAINHAAKEVGGVGGGHNIAAGATIPKGKEDEFLIILDRVIEKQLKKS